MHPERLQQLINRFAESRIAVIGDFFLDKYLDVDPSLEEISIETGKTAHQVTGIRCSPGAAGTVVNNIAALGAGELHVLGFTGDDGEGYALRQALGALGCRIDGLLTVADRFTPTYLKPRDISTRDLSGEHERYDTKNRTPTALNTQHELIGHLERLLPGVDAVIVLDQVEEEGCGVITSIVRDRIAELGALHGGKLFWADSRRRIGRFRNAIIKVNAGEAIKEMPRDRPGVGDDEEICRAVSRLRERNGRPVFVTTGRRGIWISDPEPELVRAVRVDEPTDPTGAGDSATAGAVLSLCSGATLLEAAVVANLVASITVQQLATTGTASPAQLPARLELWLSQAPVRQAENGCM